MSKMIIPVTYKLSSHGVMRSDGACIPDCDSNRDWRKYQEWLVDGNTPYPEFTAEEEAANLTATEVAEIKTDLQSQNVWMFRMIAELYKVNKINGAVNSDYDPEVLAKMQDWNQKLNRLREIDE